MERQICGLHSNKDAKYLCEKCGFFCDLKDEKDPNHILIPITQSIEGIYTSLEHEKTLCDTLKILIQGKINIFKAIKSAEINFHKAIAVAKANTQKLCKYYNKISSFDALKRLVKSNKSNGIKDKYFHLFTEQLIYLTNQIGIQASQSQLLYRIRNNTIIQSNAFQIADFNSVILNKASTAFENGNISRQSRRLIDNHNKELQLYINNMAYFANLQTAKAIKEYTCALQIYITLYGKSNNRVADVLYNMGAAYNDINDNENAVKVYNQTLSIYTQLHGKQSAIVADICCNVGALSIKMSDKTNGVNFYNDALKIYINVFGSNNKKVADVYWYIGMAYQTMGMQNDSFNSFYLAALTYYAIKYFDNMCLAFESAISISTTEWDYLTKCLQDYDSCLCSAYGKNNKRAMSIKLAMK